MSYILGLLGIIMPLIIVWGNSVIKRIMRERCKLISRFKYASYRKQFDLCVCAQDIIFSYWMNKILHPRTRERF